MYATIVRHGQSVDNIKHKYSGFTDSKITNWGFLQATLAGIHLKDLKFTHVFSSDLSRAKITCQQIVKVHDFDDKVFELNNKPIGSSNEEIKLSLIHYDPLLREQNFGIVEGLESNLPQVRDITANLYNSQLTFQQRYQLKFPNGESRLDVYNRCKQIWNSIYLKMEKDLINDKNIVPHVLIVSHGLTIKELLLAMADHPNSISDQYTYQSIQNVSCNNTGIWRVKIRNGPLRVLLSDSIYHFAGLPPKNSTYHNLPYDRSQCKLTSYFQKN